MTTAVQLFDLAKLCARETGIDVVELAHFVQWAFEREGRVVTYDEILTALHTEQAKDP